MYLAALANNISLRLRVAGYISEDEEDVLSYYLQGILSLLSVLLTVGIIAKITSNVRISCIYYTVFFVGRYCCGGYHAKTSSKCYMLTLITYMIFLIGYKVIYVSSFASVVLFVLLLCSNIFIVLFAPADTANKPFSLKEKKHFRKKSLFFILVCDLIYFVLQIRNPVFISDAVAYICGFFQLACSVIIAKVKNN